MQDSPQRGFRVVLDHLEAAVLSGDLRAGDTLPPERELAAGLGVSRTAVREAIRALQAQGIISSEVGQQGGTRVTARAGEALKRLLRLHVAVANFPVSDLTEVRVALERASVKAACEQPSADQIAQLRVVLDRMAGDLDEDAFNELDTEYHVLIAQAGANSLATDLTVAVREALREPILAAERRLASWPAFRGTLMEQHEAILGAIVARDSARAQTIIENHIRTSYAILMEPA